MKIKRREHVDDSLLDDLVSDPFLRQILARRGVLSKDDLCLRLNSILHFKELSDIDKASTLIAEAIERQERILIAGDYDVDGMTGIAIGVRALKEFGAHCVDYFIPSRYTDGYGLSEEIVKKAFEDKVGLIITVDNGISCFAAAKLAANFGIKLVITDHHEAQEILPKAAAIVDPKMPGDRFASKNICGAGVLFYVMAAVRAKLIALGHFKEMQKIPSLAKFLDLVALGTIGDVMILDANNRRLVKAGLSRMQSEQCLVGIKALAKVARMDLNSISPMGVAFDLCPKLNAPGRLKLEGNPALDLLLTDDEPQALELALKLDMCNRRRGDYERVFLKEAKADALLQQGQKVIVLYRKTWLSGLAGLIAGRIKEQFGVPCFVFAGDGEILSGSARSIVGFNLAEVLKEIDGANRDLLLRFGGHALAAGASIYKKDLPRFTECLKNSVDKLDFLNSEPEILSDGRLPYDRLNLSFARELESLGPWGNGFDEPFFDGEFIIRDTFLLANRHLKLTLESHDGWLLKAIRLRASVGEKALIPGIAVKAVFSVHVNRYGGSERLEVRIEALEAL